MASDESRMFSTHFADGKPAEKHTQSNTITDYPGKQAVSFSFFLTFFCVLLFFLCVFFFVSDQKMLPSMSHTQQSIV